MVSKATIATIWPPIAIRFTSTAGRQVSSSPRMRKAPTGRATRPKPLPEPFPVPSGPSPSPPPPPPWTFATGITVTPSFSYGSPNTRLTVRASRACPRTSWTFIAPPLPLSHLIVPLQAALAARGARALASRSRSLVPSIGDLRAFAEVNEAWRVDVGSKERGILVVENGRPSPTLQRGMSGRREHPGVAGANPGRAVRETPRAIRCQRARGYLNVPIARHGPCPHEVSLVPRRQDVCTSFGAHPASYLGGIQGREVSAMRQKVLVLGGNFGGLTAALSLKHELDGDVDVTVVSASDTFLFNPLLIWLPFGKRSAQDITFPLGPTFEAHGVDFVHATATCIDPVARRVDTTT